MDEKQAIQDLKEELCDTRCHGYSEKCKRECFVKVAIDALEKQIPIQQTYESTKLDVPCCPSCHNVIGEKIEEGYALPNFCKFCGQAIE